MHKIFLTNTECEVIQGSDNIVKLIGGFPSMENGSLERIMMWPWERSGRYIVELTFNIEGWEKTAKYYHSLPQIPKKRITIRFDGALDVIIKSPELNDCGEVKFDNRFGDERVFQDEGPWRIIEIPRPYYRFYTVGHGGDLKILFDENACTISAWFND